MLQNNGRDDLPILSNGRFEFPDRIASGEAYLVAVSNQPLLQTCSVANGSGTVIDQDVRDVDVSCE